MLRWGVYIFVVALALSLASCGRTALFTGDSPSAAVGQPVPRAGSPSSVPTAGAGMPSVVIPPTRPPPSQMLPPSRPPAAAGSAASSAGRAAPPPVDAGPPEEFCGREPGLAGLMCETCVVFVDARSQCSTDCGGTWLTALRDVNAALDLAEERSFCEVWVAAGEYHPSSDGDRTKSIRLRPQVALYGGFVGKDFLAGGENLREQRDAKLNETVLSGDIGVPGDTTDNSLHVLRGADYTIIDGFTIRGGYAERPPPGTLSSGAYANEPLYGGGMVNSAVSPRIENCVFEFNHAGLGGGAMLNVDGSPKISNCRFVTNDTPGEGGALLNDASSPELIDSAFEGNMAAAGGAMYNLNRAAPRLLRSEFRGNLASGMGGAVRNQWAPAVLDQSIFIDNVAASGGGAMYTDYTETVPIRSCVFQGNRAEGEGGALYNTLSSVNVTNSVFVGNTAERGGAISNGGTSIALWNVTIAANRAELNGGALADLEQDSEPPRIWNSIVWDNGADPISFTGPLPEIVYSVVEGGCAMDGASTPCSSSTYANRDDDPLFVRSPALSDGMLEPDYDLHVASDSPCIDAASSGATRQDIEGNQRVGERDLGAYEHLP